MQPYFPRFSNGTAGFGGVGAAALVPPSTQQNPGNAAGVALDAASGMSMQVSRDVAELLDLRPMSDAELLDHERRAMKDATALLNQRIEEVRRWLNDDVTRKRLQGRWLTRGDVELKLQVNTAAVRDTLTTQAREGWSVFSLVPTARDLFARAVIDATNARKEIPPPPVTTVASTRRPVTPSTSAATTTSTASTTTKPPVDLVMQGKMLKVLADFQSKALLALPQIAVRQLTGLWDFVQGDVEFLKEKHMAAAFPCAISLTGGSTNQPFEGVYPQPQGAIRPLRRPLLMGTPAVVARSPDSNFVRICTDGHGWKTTDFYTDEVVEAAKLALWKNVIAQGDQIYRHVLLSVTA